MEGATDSMAAMSAAFNPHEEMDQQLQSPLFNTLPAELRNYIYVLAFTPDEDLVVVNPHYKRERGNKQPTLTMTCRLIRKESLSVFYTNGFQLALYYCLSFHRCRSFCAYRWLRAVGPDIREIVKSVYVDMAVVEETSPHHPTWAQRIAILAEGAEKVRGRARIEIQKLPFEEL